MPSNTCRECHRHLSEKTSVMLGIGPICRKKMYEEKDIQGELFMVEAIPNFGDVTYSHDAEGNVITNVPRRIIRHSPDGFNFGYGGSGPADFALNILSVYIGQEEAEKYYQNFKWAFISTVPDEGGVIKLEAIMSWIEMKREAASKQGDIYEVRQ